jgi:hypothetical protein
MVPVEPLRRAHRRGVIIGLVGGVIVIAIVLILRYMLAS